VIVNKSVARARGCEVHFVAVNAGYAGAAAKKDIISVIRRLMRRRVTIAVPGSIRRVPREMTKQCDFSAACIEWSLASESPDVA
jgi:hypothetical protein